MSISTAYQVMIKNKLQDVSNSDMTDVLEHIIHVYKKQKIFIDVLIPVKLNKWYQLLNV